MWKTLLALITAAAVIGGCAEPPDELTPYVAQLEQIKEFNEQLSRYEIYLANPGLERQARDVRDVIQAYRETLDKIGSPDDKFIKATHNALGRALDRGLKQIVEPDFPTFTVSASKQIRTIRRSVEEHFDNLNKLWVKADKTEPFPHKWPASGD
tara:strand:+ start:877 stop:1338 length:462 start_codon:yes stop_codon:yes gene_type:complete